MSGQRRSAGGVTQLVTPVTSVPPASHVGHVCMCVRREGFGNGFGAAVTNEVEDVDRSDRSDVGSDVVAPTERPRTRGWRVERTGDRHPAGPAAGARVPRRPARPL